MENTKYTAQSLLRQWKGDGYSFGLDVSRDLGAMAERFGRSALVVCNGGHSAGLAENAIRALEARGIRVAGGTYAPGAKPNTPREDVYRLESYLLHHRPDFVVAIGGGSVIDACKAAIVLAAYGAAVTPELDGYFGAGLVTQAMEKTGISMIPLIAVETAASSGAHLTKYANVTDPVSGQKLLIVDPAVTPKAALFDYSATLSMPLHTTLEGALDGISHTVESFWGAKPENYELLETLAETCLELTVANTGTLVKDPKNREAREALGLATDLGGYAIMVGGTSGGHLTSFSLVHLTAHGTACGIMNPYYAVFYAPAIQPQLLVIGKILKKYGFLSEDLEALEGRARAEAVAKGMMAFAKSIGAPTKLSELPGFSEAYVKKILTAAKDPSLSSKLQNMPVPMTAADVDAYMEPVIRAAVDGDLSLIKNKPV